MGPICPAMHPPMKKVAWRDSDCRTDSDGGADNDGGTDSDDGKTVTGRGQ